MKKIRYSDEQIVRILREADKAPIAEVAKRHGVSEQASTVVTCCDGIGCNASTKGALNMTKLGFKVKELKGGLDWWRGDGHPTSRTSLVAASGNACGCD